MILFRHDIHDTSRHINLLENIAGKPVSQCLLCPGKHLLFRILLADSQGGLGLPIYLYGNLHCGFHRLCLLILWPGLLIQPALTAQLFPQFLCHVGRHGSGHALGYRTFVLQGGEDPALTDEFLADVVRSLRAEHPDCAVTLSVGERSEESYRLLREAGAERYLLRHETASDEHYRKLHPDSMSLENRKACLRTLKSLGFQVGSGFMVGSPWQTSNHLLADLRFLEELQPDMIGIGPFLRHADTPFSEFSNGSLETTLRLISILRLMFPYALIPATTALGTIHPAGRERGLAAGANVVMPNLSPVQVRSLYTLYDNKICTGEEAAECRGCLAKRVSGAGYEIVTARGDVRRCGSVQSAG